MKRFTVILLMLLLASVMLTACGSSGDTIVGETIAPMVSSTSPAKGATGVANNVSVAATFSEDMNCTSITNATFVLSSGIGNVAGDMECSGSAVLFTPAANLVDSTVYTAVLKREITDMAANKLLTDTGGVYQWDFTTGTADDSTGPGVDSTLNH